MNGLRVALVLCFGLAAAACATTSRDAFNDILPTEPAAEGEPTTQEPAPPAGEFENKTPTPTQVAEIAEVFGHSGDTLYRLDPVTKAVTVVGKFQDCKSIVDIALDESSNLFGVSTDVLYKIDKATATCTELGTGEFPNSLSFVPKGTLDPNEEALVGYDKGNYLRIDTKTGKKTKIGSLGAGALESSGDIVSVKGGATYLTVKGGTACTKNDCLVEVDPKTGKMKQNWGSIEHKNVFGLSFWGGKLYGFDDEGNLFEVTFGAKQLATTSIAIPPPPDGVQLKFWGAGSTTSAPLVQAPQ